MLSILIAVYAAANDSDKIRPLAILRLDENLQTPAAWITSVKCAAEKVTSVQKNWQPLPTEDGLLYVTRALPLTIVSPDLTKAERGVEQISDPEAKPNLERFFTARGLQNGCSGSSSFLQIRCPSDNATAVGAGCECMCVGPLVNHKSFIQYLCCSGDRWLGVVHTWWAKEGLYRVYTHHFMTLRRLANKKFTIEWVSEP